MLQEKVLIIGAGVSGSILAFYLSKHNYTITVIERSKVEQRLGQGIEIEEPALSIVRDMGILETLQKRKTGEAGTDIVDDQGRTWASFKAGGFSPTGELELMRGDLTEVLYKAADQSPNVTYRYETTIQSLTQTPDSVTVELKNRADGNTTSETFDLVIGADGQRSKTRQLIMGSSDHYNHYKPIGAYVAYFSIPKQPQDWPYSRICQFPGRRVMWARPVSQDSPYTSVYLIYLGYTPAIHAANASGDRQAQKEAMAAVYEGAGWEASRIVSQMMKAENFYSEELVQVKLPSWSQGRVALVGDSAWAPTPFTGEGNQLAIMGAYVLAQELSRTRTPLAFKNYETRFRAYVENAQTLPLGGYAQKLIVPETATGILVFRIIAWLFSQVVAFLWWTGWTSPMSGETHPKFDLEMEEVNGQANGRGKEKGL